MEELINKYKPIVDRYIKELGRICCSKFQIQCDWSKFNVGIIAATSILALVISSFVFWFCYFRPNRCYQRDKAKNRNKPLGGTKTVCKSTSKGQNIQQKKVKQKQQQQQQQPNLEKNKKKKKSSAAPDFHDSSILLKRIKGPVDSITCVCFSGNGKYLAVTSMDRTLRLFRGDELLTSNPGYIRINLPLDYGSCCAFSPDGYHVLVGLSTSRKILAYQIFFKKNVDGKGYKLAFSFPSKHNATIKSIQVSNDSKIILSCSEESELKLWNLKGVELTSLNFNQMTSYKAIISPNCQFVSACAFTGDVKIWEIIRDKHKEFSSLKRVMVLRGHKSSVLSVEFSSDSKKMVTSSKHGNWKLWNIDVRYHLDEDPKQILEVAAECGPVTLASMSPDMSMIATVIGSSVNIYSAEGKLIYNEKSTCVSNGHITSLSWNPDSNYFATGSDDRTICIWKSRNIK